MAHSESREIGPPADYDAREENKSTRRKSMSPPLDDGEAMAGGSASALHGGHDG